MRWTVLVLLLLVAVLVGRYLARRSRRHRLDWTGEPSQRKFALVRGGRTVQEERDEHHFLVHDRPVMVVTWAQADEHLVGAIKAVAWHCMPVRRLPRPRQSTVPCPGTGRTSEFVVPNPSAGWKGRPIRPRIQARACHDVDFRRRGARPVLSVQGRRSIAGNKRGWSGSADPRPRNVSAGRQARPGWPASRARRGSSWRSVPRTARA